MNKKGRVPGVMPLYFFHACCQVVLRQEELVPALAKVLGVKPDGVFYIWAARKCEQTGFFDGEKWRYFFHGLECDLKNLKDGRFLRIDFGPAGRFDAFTAWGVTQFVMTSKEPWPDFSELRDYLAKDSPPYTEHSGSAEKAERLLDRLQRWGLVDTADKQLLALAKKHTRKDPQGISVLSLPSDRPEHTFYDLSVCNRKVLSPAGRRLHNFLSRAELSTVCAP